MKTRNIPTLLALAACGTALLLSACSKKEEPITPAASGAQKPTSASGSDAQKPMEAVAREAQKAATSVGGEAQKQAEDLKTTATAAAADAQKQVEAKVVAEQGQAQGLIDRGKALLAEKKYTEALNALKGLSNLRLTAEQQKWVDELKAQIQKAMADQTASDATKAVGGLLDPKK